MPQDHGIHENLDDDPRPDRPGGPKRLGVKHSPAQKHGDGCHRHGDPGDIELGNVAVIDHHDAPEGQPPHPPHAGDNEVDLPRPEA